MDRRRAAESNYGAIFDVHPQELSRSNLHISQFPTGSISYCLLTETLVIVVFILLPFSFNPEA